jgi:hypothetical protein
MARHGARSLGHGALEIRIRAVEEVQGGEGPEDVICTLGFTRSCVYTAVIVRLALLPGGAGIVAFGVARDRPAYAATAASVLPTGAGIVAGAVALNGAAAAAASADRFGVHPGGLPFRTCSATPALGAPGVSAGVWIGRVHNHGT